MYAISVFCFFVLFFKLGVAGWWWSGRGGGAKRVCTLDLDLRKIMGRAVQSTAVVTTEQNYETFFQCNALTTSINRLCLMFVYVCFALHVWFCRLTRERVYIWEVFWTVHLLMTEFDCSEVTLCGWHDVKIQLLTYSSCTAGGVDVPCMYSHAGWELP